MQVVNSDAMRAEISFRQERLADEFRRANGLGTRRFHIRRRRTLDRVA